jgi:hypothetical protein
MFVSNSKDNQDYHNEMNGHIFRKWIEETVIPSLDVPSCLVMNNADYHNAVATEDKIPISSSTKDEIKMLLKKPRFFSKSVLVFQLFWSPVGSTLAIVLWYSLVVFSVYVQSSPIFFSLYQFPPVFVLSYPRGFDL